MLAYLADSPVRSTVVMERSYPDVAFGKASNRTQRTKVVSKQDRALSNVDVTLAIPLTRNNPAEGSYFIDARFVVRTCSTGTFMGTTIPFV